MEYAVAGLVLVVLGFTAGWLANKKYGAKADAVVTAIDSGLGKK